LGSWLDRPSSGFSTGVAPRTGAYDGRSCLTITGRKKEIFITSGGKNIAPSEVENALKSSSFIRQAISIGEARPYCTALIEIDEDMVADWAQSQGVRVGSFRALTEEPAVRRLIAAEVDRANARVSRAAQARRHALLPRPLDIDRDEVTPTQKVKRYVIEEHFAELVASLYG